MPPSFWPTSIYTRVFKRAENLKLKSIWRTNNGPIKFAAEDVMLMLMIFAVVVQFFVFVLYTVVRAKSSPIFIDLINVRLGLYSILMRKTNHYYLPRTDSREKSREYNCNFFSARSFQPCTSRRCQQSSMITKTIDTLDERHNGDKP